ncbi:hypothetical protein Vretimale_7073 [Volvox reticuliferus]|uniref:Uncharacterized protein n=1 Tax=Volvox reticuliferus TaxID=1737510 RepID=A0A8J4G894_9CHLO|nr:hypothetical protein Vretifemale_10960 [Volvox reticuliferus]GIM02160.1 hypothetical protein Vretimale_7073 [Volvox reticuliferus]
MMKSLKYQLPHFAMAMIRPGPGPKQRLRGGKIAALPPLGDKYIQLRNRLKEVGATDEQADLVISEFVPNFVFLEWKESVQVQLSAIDKKLEMWLSNSESNLESNLESKLPSKLESKLNNLMTSEYLDRKFRDLQLQLVVGASVIALAAVTSRNWVPVLVGLLVK